MVYMQDSKRGWLAVCATCVATLSIWPLRWFNHPKANLLDGSGTFWGQKRWFNYPQKPNWGRPNHSCSQRGGSVTPIALKQCKPHFYCPLVLSGFVLFILIDRPKLKLWYGLKPFTILSNYRGSQFTMSSLEWAMSS